MLRLKTTKTERRSSVCTTPPCAGCFHDSNACRYRKKCKQSVVLFPGRAALCPRWGSAEQNDAWLGQCVEKEILHPLCFLPSHGQACDHVLIEKGVTFSDYHKDSIWTHNHPACSGPKGCVCAAGAAFTVSFIYF